MKKPSSFSNLTRKHQTNLTKQPHTNTIPKHSIQTPKKYQKREKKKTFCGDQRTWRIVDQSSREMVVDLGGSDRWEDDPTSPASSPSQQQATTDSPEFQTRDLSEPLYCAQ